MTPESNSSICFFQLSYLSNLLADIVMGEYVINHSLQCCNSKKHLPVHGWLSEHVVLHAVLCISCWTWTTPSSCIADKEEFWHLWHPRFHGLGLYLLIKVPICTCFSIILLVVTPKPVFSVSKKLLSIISRAKTFNVFPAWKAVSLCSKVYYLSCNMWVWGRLTQLPLGIVSQK